MFPLVLYAGEPAQPPRPVDELAMGEGVSVTIYNQEFAVVKERRFMDLAAGRQTVKFTNVAEKVDPTSVSFSSLTDPEGTRVVEQNFEFDLVSADKLMRKYIDKKISIITQDGRQIDGYLMNYDGAQIVLAKDEKGNEPQIVPRADNVKDVRFPSLPEGLLTKPTLVWTIDAKKAGKHLVKVAYITAQVNWHAEYTAIASDDEAKLDLSGWVSVDNRSGAAYRDAGVKLMAGEVHRVQELPPARPMAQMRKAAAEADRGFEEKAFAEYHLYTLRSTSTLGNMQVKQMELLTADAVPVTKVYTYRGFEAGRARSQGSPGVGPGANTLVTARLRLKNDKASNMGIPLPKGNVRVYKRDTDGQLEFLGNDRIDHTPKDEKVDIYIGDALDIVGERRQTVQRRPAERVSEEDISIRIRNHKDTPVTVNVEEVLQSYANWDVYKQDTPFTKLDFRTIRFEIAVPANSEKVINYSVRYTW
jgi:hypothetical protein